MSNRSLTLILALLPTLALAEPLRIGPTNVPSDTRRWLDGCERDLGGMVYDGKNITISRNVIRTCDEQDSNIVIKNAEMVLKQPTTGSNLPVAIEHSGGGYHLVENVIARHFRMVPVNGVYPNGDCFSGERDSHHVTYRNTLASDCSNGGYDFKSTDLHFDNATAEDVDFGFRIWGINTTATLITVRRWRNGAVQMNPGPEGASPPIPATFVVDKLHLEPDDSPEGVLVGVRAGGVLNIKSCSGSLGNPARSLIYWNGTTPAATDLTLCGVKVDTKDEAVLRPLIEAQMAKDAAPPPATPATAGPVVLCAFATKLKDGNNDGLINTLPPTAQTCGAAPQHQRTVKFYQQNPTTGQFEYIAP